ncbi:tyrosine-type recombinase/integrase [Arcobacter ellisii]|uniref:Site-specific tyrosine recombinase, phage integrase family n=1 Tax=Arcobacter ellisii TaxID=913109 RepID=A0A347UA11_9BACT|nr:tyrosine-type recombinase/integrase [Arcobacter ellisii]AXX95689.1 site-specific tyrosine recombinase, phage integrase family [Arcobacter ellisii]RXI31438.1 hypothetical protein CP962_04820 [Arcobacter ellisii]
MKIYINNEWHISTIINNVSIEFSHANAYSKYLTLIKNLSPITIKNNMSSLNKFWIWSLAVSPEDNESLAYYIARYRLDLEKGFIIYDYNKEEKVKFPISIIRSNSQTTIDNEVTNIKNFFTWLSETDDKFNMNRNTINLKKEYYRKINGKHSDYISTYINKLSRERILKKVYNIPSNKKRIVNVEKAFPYDYFIELIKISDIREKLLYLLMGGTSARISQVLNLTIYDIDYENMNVYLSDPSIDDENQRGYLGETRKKWLFEKYNIDVKYQHPHNLIQFKYPIPKRPNTPLYWLNEEIKLLFFGFLSEYNIFPENQRMPIHPFFFTKKNGERLLYKPVYNKFLKHCEILSNYYNDKNLLTFSPHSLRHMWGNYLAELYSLAINIEDYSNAEKIKIYAKEGMGHSNEDSTKLYFNINFNKDFKDITYELSSLINQYKHLPPQIFTQGLKNEN